MIGDLIQSCWDMRGRFNDHLCLASMCFIKPLYNFLILLLSLRALMSCSPMHVIYAFLMRMICSKHNLGKLCDGV